MAEPSSITTPTTYSVPEQVHLFGVALKPVAAKLHRDMKRKAGRSKKEFNTLPDVGYHLSVISRAITQSDVRVKDLMKTVMQNDKATALDVGRTAGRLEHYLSEFVNSYRECMASAPGPEFAEVHEVVLGIYQHHISEMLQWLDKTVALSTDTTRAVRNQLVHVDESGVKPRVTVALCHTAAPQSDRLTEIIQDLLAEPDYEPPIQESRSGPGLLATLGAMAFGLNTGIGLWGK